MFIKGSNFGNISVHLNILSLISAVLEQAQMPQPLRGHVSFCAEKMMVPALSKDVKVAAETRQEHKVHQKDVECV